MKGGKDEEKRMDRLFPRLRINDAEKEGSWPSPRNKMALCEPLSIPLPPSQVLFIPGSASMLPLPPRNTTSSLASSVSSSHGDIRKQNFFFPFSDSLASSHLVEKLHFYSPSGVNLNMKLKDIEWKSLKSINNRTLNAIGRLTTSTKCSLFQPHNISKSQISSVKKPGADNNYGVPIFAQSMPMPNCGTNDHWLDKEKLTSSSGQLQTSFEKTLPQTVTSDLSSRQHPRNQTEEIPKTSQNDQDSAKKPPAFLSNGDKLSADASPSLFASHMISEQINRAYGSLNPIIPKKRSRLLEDLSRLRDHNAESSQKHRVLQENKALKDGVPTEPNKVSRKRSASILAGESRSTLSLEGNHTSPKKPETANRFNEDNDFRSLEAGNTDINVDVLDNSVVDSVSGLDISPDDVVDMIGQKQFWKAKRIIVLL